MECIRKSQYYSILFDETTDISHTSQISLSSRNIDEENKIHEPFIEFINFYNYVHNKYEYNNINNVV